MKKLFMFLKGEWVWNVLLLIHKCPNSCVLVIIILYILSLMLYYVTGKIVDYLSENSFFSMHIQLCLSKLCFCNLQLLWLVFLELLKQEYLSIWTLHIFTEIRPVFFLSMSTFSICLVIKKVFEISVFFQFSFQ